MENVLKMAPEVEEAEGEEPELPDGEDGGDDDDDELVGHVFVLTARQFMTLIAAVGALLGMIIQGLLR